MVQKGLVSKMRTESRAAYNQRNTVAVHVSHIKHL